MPGSKRTRELRSVLERFPPRQFHPGETLVHNTRHQAASERTGSLAYIVEGLVRGGWARPFIAPEHEATTIVAGDGRWIGADAFKYGENLFRYEAVTLTRASIVPLAYLRAEAPRGVLLDTLQSVSLDWCAAASVLGLGAHSLERRTMLLLYNLARLHPRPEIEVRHQDVAELLGVARQTLQPVLKRIERAGLVTLGYGEITVGEPDALLAALRDAALRPRTRSGTRR